MNEENKGIEIEFRTKNEKQLLAASYWIDNETEEIVYGGAKYGGKSYLGCSMIFGDALTYPETHYFIARQELTDLRKYTIPSIHEVFTHWGLDIGQYAPYNGQDNCYNLYNGSKVYLIACKELPSDPMFERFGSMQMTRGWIEEAGEIAEAAKRNLALSIGRWNNDKYRLKKKLLITCNPKKGWLKIDYIDLWKQGLLPLAKKFIQAFATDNVHGAKDYVTSLSEIKDKVTRQRLWEGDWEYDEDENSLISFDALSDCFTNTIIKSGEEYLTMDIARFGRDSTVFSFWDDLEITKIARFQKQGTEVTEEQAKDFLSKEKIPYSHTSIDEDGVGGGVVDHLQGVKGFVANSSPIPTATQIRIKKMGYKAVPSFIPRTNFANLKSQCGFKLAELINEHKISFAGVPEYREMIIEELTALLKQKDKDKDGKLQLVPKDEVKEDIRRSPDIGDAIIQRMWFELKKEALQEDPNEDKKLRDAINTQFMRNISRQSLNSMK